VCSSSTGIKLICVMTVNTLLSVGVVDSNVFMSNCMAHTCHSADGRNGYIPYA